MTRLLAILIVDMLSALAGKRPMFDQEKEAVKKAQHLPAKMAFMPPQIWIS